MPEVLLANIADLVGLQGAPGQDGADGADGGGMIGPGTATEDNITVFGATPETLKDGGSSIVALLARTAHTGEQAIATITGLQAALDAATAAIALKFALANIDTDGTFAANSDSKVASQKATKTLFDSLASGQFPKPSVRVKSTVNGALATAFENGDTVNGVVLATNDRILIAAQTASLENGIYTVNASGAPTRALDANTGAELIGAWVPVIGGGSVDDNTIWICTSPGPITLETTAIVFTKVPAVGAYSAGTNLILTATSFAVNMADQTEAEAGVSTKVLSVLQGGQQLRNMNYAAEGATTTRSNTERWSDKVYVMDHGADPTGVTTNFHTAFEAAVAEAISRNRSQIVIPSGLFTLGGTATILNENTSKYLHIVGDGSATRIRKSAGTNTWFQIGANTEEGEPGALRTGGVVFEDMAMEPSVAMTANEVFNLKFVKDVAFHGILFGTVSGNKIRQAFNIGGGATLENNCIYIDIDSCPMFSTGVSGVPMIELGAGASLNIKGWGRHDGQDDAFFIQHSHTTLNWDGLYVYDQFAAGFQRYVNSVGKGIGNLIWKGGQADGAAIAFNAVASSDGENVQWDIIGVHMLNQLTGRNLTDVSRPLIWSNASAGRSMGIKFIGNRIKHYNSYMDIVSVAGPSNVPCCAVIEGNQWSGSGKGVGGGGTPLIRMAGTNCVIIGNNSYTTGLTANTFGMQWAGTSNPTGRIYANNLWLGAGTAGTTIIGDTGTR